MYVRCTHCGYDNSPEYRFCGMCGASLSRTPVEPPPPSKEVVPAGPAASEQVPVNGPSFLGLSEDPKSEFHYLYEDEAPPSRVGFIVLMLIILGAAGFLGWQWQHGGYPFNRQTASSGGSQQSASPSEVAPAMSQNQETHIDKPMTGVGDVLPNTPDQKTHPDSTGKSTEFPAQPGENPASSAASSSGAPASNGVTRPEKPTPPPETEEAEAGSTPAPAKPAAAKPARKLASTRTVVSEIPASKPPKPSATSPDADLELAGERYLYGTGVPRNCARAESSLRTAAAHGNTKAETVLGTMYATGHCVGRDLPAAYRWFARALHQEPQNSRISADLQVLWRQMSPQEKQLATASGQ